MAIKVERRFGKEGGRIQFTSGWKNLCVQACRVKRQQSSMSNNGRVNLVAWCFWVCRLHRGRALKWPATQLEWIMGDKGVE
jgi:hypothetical protein